MRVIRRKDIVLYCFLFSSCVRAFPSRKSLLRRVTLLLLHYYANLISRRRKAEEERLTRLSLLTLPCLVSAYSFCPIRFRPWLLSGGCVFFYPSSSINRRYNISRSLGGREAEPIFLAREKPKTRRRKDRSSLQMVLRHPVSISKRKLWPEGVIIAFDRSRRPNAARR